MNCHLSRLLSPEIDAKAHHIRKLRKHITVWLKSFPENQKLKSGTPIVSDGETVKAAVRKNVTGE